MVYMQIMLGIGCVVIAAATAVYFSMSQQQQSHQTHYGRRRNARDDNDDDNTSTNPSGIIDRNRLRASRPGDKCILCLEVMTSDTMHTMHCGHALHHTPCYSDYRNWRRQCPLCNQLVIRIDLPGEDCAICCEPMELENMQYLRCEHALHTNCLSDYKRNNYTNCPVCARQL